MHFTDKYLLYSSVFALFTEAFSFKFGIDLKLFYVILLFNLTLLGYRNQLSIHKNLLIVLGFLLVHGIIMCAWYGNPIKSLLAQLVGVSICSVYYYSFLKIFNTKKAFETYLKFALWVSLISFAMYFYNEQLFKLDRLKGILLEPAHYAAIMLPAVYASFMRKQFVMFAIVTLTVLLTQSFVGYVGLLLMIFVPLLKIKYLIKYSWIGIILLIAGLYYVNIKWNVKADENKSNFIVRRIKETKESLNAVTTGQFKEHANLSSYAFLSNIFITKQIFIKSPLGTGLGSYSHQYEKYYPLLKPPAYIVTLKHSKINKTDANSLFLRMVSDLGIFAFLMILYFCVRTRNLFLHKEKISSQGVFFYLMTKLIREGHYFPPEFYFFLLIFLKNFNEDTAHS